MKFYNKYYANNYEELLTYYPRYYREVYEMAEILKANGSLLDELENRIEQTFFNNFIDYADEATLSKLEKFLGIPLNTNRTLDERRRLIKAYFIGFGKVSASLLEEMIESYTHAKAKSRFEPSDEAGNNTLYIEFQRGNEPNLYMADITTFLAKKIPAHITWQASVVYCFPVGVSAKRKYHKFDYELTGLEPDISMIADYMNRASVTKPKNDSRVYLLRQSSGYFQTGTIPDEALRGFIRPVEAVCSTEIENVVHDFKSPSDSTGEAGGWPQITSVGLRISTESLIKAETESRLYEHEQSGVLPEPENLAAMAEIDAGAEVKAVSSSVDYIYCGTRYTQS